MACPSSLAAADLTLARSVTSNHARRFVVGRMASPNRRHAFLGEFIDRLLVLGQMRQSHATQHVRCLGELDIFVADNFNAIAPRVEKVEKRAGQRWITTWPA